MNNKYITDLNAKLVTVEGTNKEGKKYKLTKLVVNTEIYGEVEIVLNTRTDRAGIVLDLLASHLA